jgi:O-antigen/teichoic acid export membrane protein
VVGSTAARILAFVGVLRALSYVAQPLLDGLGHPEKTLRYQLVATLVMPTLFVVSAVTLGRHMGALSVALAWAVGYPVAFCFVMGMSFRAIDLGVREYLRGVIGIAACLAAAFALGAVVRELTSSSPPLLRLTAIVATVVFTAGGLLARFQGISPVSVWRSTKSRRA